MAAVFAVNVSYPEWSGGWSTGPRLLVPLLPFAMLPVAALLATGRRWALAAALLLSIAGGVLMFLFVGVGARIPPYYDDPLLQVVVPQWTGTTLPEWKEGPFARNVFGLALPGAVVRLPTALRGLQFLPLLLAQGGAITLLWLLLRPARQSARVPGS
jgi:hypothetical protein